MVFVTHSLKYSISFTNFSKINFQIWLQFHKSTLSLIKSKIWKLLLIDDIKEIIRLIGIIFCIRELLLYYDIKKSKLIQKIVKIYYVNVSSQIYRIPISNSNFSKERNNKHFWQLPLHSLSILLLLFEFPF